MTAIPTIQLNVKDKGKKRKEKKKKRKESGAGGKSETSPPKATMIYSVATPRT